MPPMPSNINQRLYTEGGHLLTTQPYQGYQWRQGIPFNTETPYVLYNGVYIHALVGCGALAWGQIMDYHKWPLRSFANNNIVYRDSYGHDINRDIRTNYNWDNLDVPKLLFNIGVALRSDYVFGGTFIGIDDNIMIRIAKHFGYSSNVTRQVYKFDGSGGVSQTQFTNEIIENINNSLPIFLFLGFDNYSIGHLVVIDGYKYENNLFYMSLAMGLGSGNHDDFYTITSNDLISADYNASGLFDLRTFTELETTSDIIPCNSTSTADCDSDYLSWSSSYAQSHSLNSDYFIRPTMNLVNGWNLKALMTDEIISLRDLITNSSDVAWVYENGSWYSSASNPTKLVYPKQGIWIYSNTEREVYTQRGEHDSDSVLNSTDLNSLSTNTWYLKGTSKAISSSLYNGFDTQVYRNNAWQNNPLSINAGEGVWIKKN